MQEEAERPAHAELAQPPAQRNQVIVVHPDQVVAASSSGASFCANVRLTLS